MTQAAEMKLHPFNGKLPKRRTRPMRYWNYPNALVFSGLNLLHRQILNVGSLRIVKFDREPPSQNHVEWRDIVNKLSQQLIHPFLTKCKLGHLANLIDS